MKQNWEEQMKNSLGNYQQLPSRDLWPEIERELDKRDKKRTLVIPLWWKTGAIVATAASLALIIFLNPAQNIEDNSFSQVTQATENSDTRSSDFTDPIQMDKAGQQADEFLADSDQKLQNLSSALETTQSASVSVDKATKNNENKGRRAGTIDQSSVDHTGLAHANQPQPGRLSSRVKSLSITQEENAITPINNASEVATVAPDTQVTEINNTATNIAVGDQKDNTPTELIEELQGPVSSLVADQEVTAPLKDESEALAWSIMPVAGPVYYNSLSQGSVFDPSLSDNARQGDITFSYGLRVNLAFNERITLRAGINSVAMGYATQDIEIATGPAAFGLSSVNYNDNRNIISVFDKGTVPVNPDPSNPYSQLNLKSTTGETSIRANLNYLEFPVELSYALIDQQVKLSLISGVSGLVLNNNEVSVNDGQNRYVLGSLNNLNQFSFSTNIGLGLNYTLFKGFNFQLEPTFKYQLGAYNDANVEFTPYQLVLLSGVQFQF